jgi:hypothetical protein
VVDPDGNAIAGATVHASGVTPADGVTDGAGRVRLAPLIPGAYRVLATRDGFAVGDRTGAGESDHPSKHASSVATHAELRVFEDLGGVRGARLSAGGVRVRNNFPRDPPPRACAHIVSAFSGKSSDP